LAESPLGQAFELLSYDQRGLGRSSVPPWPYAMADFAADAAALIDAVGWDDCLVIGLSFGGMVAQELAIRHPERVTRQVGLLDTRWDEAWRRDHPDMVALIAQRMPAAEQPPEGLTNQLAARAQHDTTARLGRIACPTLVCGGRYDGIAPPANSERLAQEIPDARLALFDGGHAFMLQDPAAWPAILEFLGGGTAG
jgi:3-oxoadipate enol-lactonase